MNSKNWIVEGMTVRHVTNEKQLMTVERLCYKEATVICDKNDNGAYYHSELHDFVKIKKILLGVICRWMDNNGELRNAQFHSRELMPVNDGPDSQQRE